MRCVTALGLLKPLPNVKPDGGVTCWWEGECAVCGEPLLYGTKKNKRGEHVSETVYGIANIDDLKTVTQALCAVHYRQACEEEEQRRAQDNCG